MFNFFFFNFNLILFYLTFFNRRIKAAPFFLKAKLLITIRFCSIAYSLWTKSVICILPPRSHSYIALPSNSLTKKRSQSYCHWNITHNFRVQQACDNYWILRPFFFFCFFFLIVNVRKSTVFRSLKWFLNGRNKR